MQSGDGREFDGGCILVVGDIFSDAGHERSHFWLSPYPVVRVETVDTALYVAKTDRPIAIVIDVAMKSAWIVCRLIRSDPATSEIPVIVVARGPHDREHARCLSHGHRLTICSTPMAVGRAIAIAVSSSRRRGMGLECMSPVSMTDNGPGG